MWRRKSVDLGRSIDNSGGGSARGQQERDRKRLNGTCLRRAAPSSPRSEEWRPSCSSSIPMFRPLSRQHPVLTRSKYIPNNFPIPLRTSWFTLFVDFPPRLLTLSTHFLSLTRISNFTTISDHRRTIGTLTFPFTIYNNPPCLTVGPAADTRINYEIVDEEAIRREGVD